MDSSKEIRKKEQMSATRPDPGAIMRLATGYWDSMALLTANELNLFGALADGPLSVREVAARLQAEVRAASMLLDACAGLGLLIKELREPEPIYANTPETAAYLVPGRPGYLGDALRWSTEQYSVWGQLALAVKTGGPVVPPATHLGADPQRTRTFVLGMHSRAHGTARGVLPFLDFTGVRELLDVGGGPGTYSMLIAQKYPQMRVTVLDLPAVVEIAAELIAQAGLADRVRTQAGDAVAVDYGVEAFDGTLFSGVLHQMSAATVQEMLAKARRALKPGGRLVISDIMLDNTKAQPPFAALFSLQMLLTSEAGAVFSAEECGRWLKEAGFANVTIHRLPPPLPYFVINGNRN